ncbi:MAG: hypothetical protein HUU16_00080 [Candidatus Omnitrophica bacterium]|nr:hypothetical protein [Candidatus Omnitrophota bacterium]
MAYPTPTASPRPSPIAFPTRPGLPSPALAAPPRPQERSSNDVRSHSVIGNKSSRVYHSASCRHVERIRRENVVQFPSPTSAQAAGYRPCKVCGG